jgi:hypothetical protein
MFCGLQRGEDGVLQLFARIGVHPAVNIQHDAGVIRMFRNRHTCSLPDLPKARAAVKRVRGMFVSANFLFYTILIMIYAPRFVKATH